MNCYQPTLLAYLGSILINAGFLTFVFWCIGKYWILGVIFSCVHTFVLFVIAFLIEDNFVKGDKNTIASANTNVKKKIRWSKSLFHLTYALGVLSIGCSGLLISFTPFRCKNGSTYEVWNDLISILPQNVREWAKQDIESIPSIPSFAYFPTSGVTIFSGIESEINESGSNFWKLWRISANDRIPELLSHSGSSTPSEFVSILENTKCLIAGDTPSEDTINVTQVKNYQYIAQVVMCSDDGETFRSTKNVSIVDPRHIFADLQQMKVWIICNALLDGYYRKAIYSIDPITMIERLEILNEYSSFGDGAKNQNCEKSVIVKQRSIRNLFFSALPMILVSMISWKRKEKVIPTMGITFYSGLNSVIISILSLIHPDLGHSSISIWLCLSLSSCSAFWLLFFMHSVQKVDKETYNWSMEFVGLVFFISTIFAIGITSGHDEWFRWVTLNIISFIPLVVVGIISELFLVTFLGYTGLILDSIKIANEVSGMTGGNVYVPIYISTLVLFGIIIGYLCWFLLRHQRKLQAIYFQFLNQEGNEDQQKENIPQEITIKEEEKDLQRSENRRLC